MDSESAIIMPGNKPFITTRFLPKTGSILSFWPFGDDGDYQKGWAIGERFVIKTIGGDEIVFDRATGLMWPRDHNQVGGNNGTLNRWGASLNVCNGITFAGYDDWRLPNIIEIFSIGDFNKAVGPTCFDPFVNMKSGYYWSSTTNAQATDYAHVFSFLSPTLTSHQKGTNDHYLLAVRKGLPG